MSNARKKETESLKAKGERSGVTWSKETLKRNNEVVTNGTMVATRN